MIFIWSEEWALAHYICFKRIFPSTVDYYADEEKIAKSTFVSLSLTQSVDFVYTLSPVFS